MQRTSTERRIITECNPKSPVSESYRTLRTNIEFASLDQEVKTIAVTSAQPEEGKTTTSINLAVAFAQAEKKVLLVDADLRKPSVHYYLQKSNRQGLTSVVAKRGSSIQSIIQDTHIDNLSVITSGPIPPNPSEILSSNRMTEIIHELRESFDVIIFDTPPSLAVTDAQIVAAKCDGTVIVVSSGKVKAQSALKVKAALEHVKAKILGVVINNIQRKSKGEQYYYYGNRGQESI